MSFQFLYYPPGSGIPTAGQSGQGSGAPLTISLRTLTLSANTFSVGDPQNTFVGNVINTTSGSTVTFASLSVANSLQLVNTGGTWSVQVGSAAPGAPTTLTFNLVETLASAVNSPNTTSGFSVNEVSSSLPIIQLVLDMSVTFPIAA